MTPLFRAQRRARRMLLWFAIALVLSVVPGSILVDRCPLAIRFPAADMMLRRWRESNPRPDVILLGSSRMGFATWPCNPVVNARQFTGDNSLQVFNASMVVSGPLTIEFLTKKFLDEGAAPRLAIIEVNADFIGRTNRLFEYVIEKHLTASDLPRVTPEICSFSSRSIGTLASSRLIPFYKHRSILLDWAGSRLAGAMNIAWPVSPSPDTGQVALPLVAPLEPDSLSTTIENPSQGPVEINQPLIGPLAGIVQQDAKNLGSAFRGYKLQGYTSDALVHTIAMLRARGCEVVLVEMPLTSPLRALSTPEANTQFSAFIERMQSDYGCTFINLSDRIPDALFRDAHHVNGEGSRRFVQILGRDVIAPAWKRLLKKEDPGVLPGTGTSQR